MLPYFREIVESSQIAREMSDDIKVSFVAPIVTCYL